MVCPVQSRVQNCCMYVVKANDRDLVKLSSVKQGTSQPRIHLLTVDWPWCKKECQQSTCCTKTKCCHFTAMMHLGLSSSSQSAIWIFIKLHHCWEPAVISIVRAFLHFNYWWAIKSYIRYKRYYLAWQHLEEKPAGGPRCCLFHQTTLKSFWS